MRAKVLISALAIGIVVVAPAIYFHYKPTESASAPARQAAVDDTPAAPSQAVPPILKRASSGAQAATDGVKIEDNSDSALPHDEYVIKRKSDLYDMGMGKDPASLKVILAEMHNADPEIRQAALSAVIDFGSQDAIPALQNELSWASDLQEKVEIQKAIDFLQLPHLGQDGGSITQSSDGSAPVSN